MDTQYQLHPTNSSPPFLLRNTLTQPIKMAPGTQQLLWVKQPHPKPSFWEPFLETRTTKTLEVRSVGSPKSYKWASKIKTSLFPPTVTNSNWNTCLRSILYPNTSSLCTAPNLALTQPTSPLNRDPPFAESNSPNKKPPIRHCCHVFHDLRYFVPPILVSSYKHRAFQIMWFGLQTADIQNHVLIFLHQEHNMYQTRCLHLTNQL